MSWLTLWKARTNTGRVVYPRPKHYMTARDALRIVFEVYRRMSDNWDLEKDPKYGDIWAWERIMDVASLVCKRLWVQPDLPQLKPHYNQVSGKTTPTDLHWLAARLIYHIEWIQRSISAMLDIMEVPFVKEVWKVGNWILTIALDGLKDKMGRYNYVPNPESLTLY